MNPLELSTTQKKIARQTINTGLEREFIKGIGKIDKIIQQWKDGKRDVKETYYKVYSTIEKFDKHIGKLYNNISGSDYLWVLAAQLNHGIISPADLSELDQETLDKIILMSRIDEE